MVSSARTARGAAAAAMAMGLAIAATLLLAAPTRAWASDAGASVAADGAGAATSAPAGAVSGSVGSGYGAITVTPAEGASTSLTAYQLFAADVTDAADGSKVVANVAWASDGAREAVERAISSVDASYAGTTAQDAADWLSERMGAGASTDGAETAQASSVAAAIAEAVLSAGSLQGVALSAGTQAELPQGYWLIVSPDAQASSDQSSQAGTSPILAVVGGSAVTASVKAAVPTVGKHVLEDSTDSWQAQADATVGDELDWRLEATVPADVTGYDAYSVTFHDTLSAGLERPSDVHVYVAAGAQAADGADAFWGEGTTPDATWLELDAGEYTTSYSAQDDGATFDLTVSDLVTSLSRRGLSLSGGVRVCVVYDAPLTEDAQLGTAEGNPDTVTLRYPRAPYSDGYGETQPQTAIAYSWELSLVKRDSSTDAALAGAVLRVTDDRGRHLTQDGAWTSDDATVTTDADGRVSARGVDAGAFTVEEVAAPQGYAAFDGQRTVTLSVGLDAEHVVHSRIDADVKAESPLRADSFDAAGGAAEVSVLDTPGSTTPGGGTGGSAGGNPVVSAIASHLPKTGDATSYALAVGLVVAGALLIVLAHRLRKRGGER